MALVFLTTQCLQLPAVVRADAPVPLVLKATAITGNARYVDKNHRKWTELQVGDQLGDEAVVQTDGKGSSANIADLEVSGAEAGGRARIRMLSNTVLEFIRLSAKNSDSVEARDISLDMRVGQIRVSLDGVSPYSFTLINGGSTRVAVPRSAAGPKETVFVFNGSLTVLKGAVTVSTRSGAEKVVHAGEQLRSGASEVTKTPPEAPELKSEQ